MIQEGGACGEKEEKKKKERAHQVQEACGEWDDFPAPAHQSGRRAPRSSRQLLAQAGDGRLVGHRHLEPVERLVAKKEEVSKKKKK